MMIFISYFYLLIISIGIVQSEIDQDESRQLPRQCGYSNATRIVGGQLARRNSWRWQAAVFLDDYFYCGGSVINSKWILGAAHCIQEDGVIKSARRYKIMLGAQNHTARDGRIFAVSRVVVHSGFNENTFQNDIALYRLDHTIDFTFYNKTIAPVCLAHASLNTVNLEDRRAVVTGWGSTYFNGLPVDLLRQVLLPIQSQADCQEVYGSGQVTKLNICAGLDQGGKDSCQGDSGGPLTIMFTDNTYTQVGVVSWGDGCAKPNAYGVYTRVSQFYDWIIDQIGPGRHRDEENRYLDQKHQDII